MRGLFRTLYAYSAFCRAISATWSCLYSGHSRSMCSTSIMPLKKAATSSALCRLLVTTFSFTVPPRFSISLPARGLQFPRKILAYSRENASLSFGYGLWCFPGSGTARGCPLPGFNFCGCKAKPEINKTQEFSLITMLLGVRTMDNSVLWRFPTICLLPRGFPPPAHPKQCTLMPPLQLYQCDIPDKGSRHPPSVHGQSGVLSLYFSDQARSRSFSCIP